MKRGNGVNCPICKSNKTRSIELKDTVYSITNRKHLCTKCLLTFKTKEVVMFESIPGEIRKRYLETGKLK